MSLRRLLRKLKLRWLAGLAGGFAFACSGRPAPEVAPMAPRPEPMQPAPGQPKAPVPGSPDPLPAPPDGAPVTNVPAPSFQSSHEAMNSEPDAGVPSDAVELPPIPDALPADANKQPESPGYPCC